MSNFLQLTEAQALVRDTARNYAQKTLAPIAARLDREGRFPREQLAGLAELGMMGVNIAEEYAGSDAGALRTTARRDGTDYVINGSKQWITSGDQAGVIIVWARTGVEGTKGISSFLVEGGSKGLHVGRHEDKMGLRASSTVALAFEDVRVPSSAMLGREGRGFPIALAAL